MFALKFVIVYFGCVNKKILLLVVVLFIVLIAVFAFSPVGGFLKGSLRKVAPQVERDFQAERDFKTDQSQTCLVRYPKDFTDISIKYIDQDGWNIYLYLDNQVPVDSIMKIEIGSAPLKSGSAYAFGADVSANSAKLNLLDLPLENKYVSGGFVSNLKALCADFGPIPFNINVSLDVNNQFKEANESNNKLSYAFTCPAL